jgi:chitodextrinase
VVTTLGANATSYQDNGLAANTSYFYKVRALRTAYPSSAWSNIAGGATFSYSVYVNFNRDNPAAAPWNNTNNVPQLGSVYSLNNETGNPTGIAFEVTKDFSGENPFGMNTGNNSGVFPDNVIRSTWWLDANVTSSLKITGLSQAQAYTFVFFGSRSGTGNRTTVYEINGKSVQLNASNNTMNTVQLEGIRPDENGELVVNISLAPGAIFGYLGAMVIHAYNVPNTEAASAAPPPNTVMQVGRNGIRSADAELTAARRATETKLGVYPTPFNNQLTVSAEFTQPQSQVTVRIVDVSGRTVWSRQYREVPQGRWTQSLDLSGTTAPAGVYFLQLHTADSRQPAHVKLQRSPQ